VIVTMVFTALRKASAVYAMANPSVCYTLVLCQNHGMQRVFTVG